MYFKGRHIVHNRWLILFTPIWFSYWTINMISVQAQINLVINNDKIFENVLPTESMHHFMFFLESESVFGSSDFCVFGNTCCKNAKSKKHIPTRSKLAVWLCGFPSHREARKEPRHKHKTMGLGSMVKSLYTPSHAKNNPLQRDGIQYYLTNRKHAL